MKFSKIVISFILIFLFLFTFAVLYAFYKVGSEPSTLITAVFGFCALEGGALALIKSLEIKKEVE